MFTAKEVLEIIDSCLAEESSESAWLWQVLTALRGPDNEDSELKTRTTARLRAVALPKTAQRAFEPIRAATRGYSNGASFVACSLEELVTQEGEAKAEAHFWNHFYHARLALQRISEHGL